MVSLVPRMSRLAVALVLAVRILPGAAEQVLVAELVDDIVSADIVRGGNCESGCTREVHSVAHVDGTPENEHCTLETRTPFDTSEPMPGLLTARIYCEDETGNLIKEGTGPCRFEVCVDFQWKDEEADGTGGQLEYDVVIIRESKPRAPHTVYVDLSVEIDPTATDSNVNSCQADATCAGLKECTSPAGYRAEILLVDTVGDGWVGGIDGRFNMWTLTNTDNNFVISRGTLADNHDSSTMIECLEDGEYIFETTANAAFAEDMRWTICDNNGLAGEGVRFIVEDGKCNKDAARKIERATAEESSDDFGACSLPLIEENTRTAPCTTLSSGLKVDGVAMYFDERCTQADYSGCGARSIDSCRLCFVDKELWMQRFPNDRVPDYEMCPCCVANLLGIDCATASSGGGTDNRIIIAVSVAIVGVIAIALCLSCAFGPTILRVFRGMRKKKHPDLEMDLDINGAAAFPDSPTAGNGGTLNGNSHGHRGRVVSGHFPIPRFDSIRGRFDSGIFASNNTAAYTAPGATGNGTALPGTMEGADVRGEKHHKDASVATVATALSSPLAAQVRASPNAPRSTVLEGRMASKGYTTSDVGKASTGGASRAAGWGIAMSGEYPDLDASDPYAGDNAMVEAGGADHLARA